MSTRANIIIKGEDQTIYFYRHSDGYPECTGKDLTEFVAGYATKMRSNPGQSAGWLVLHGHNDPAYAPRPGYEWKCGAYEPTDKLHSDIEYVYVIDLDHRILSCRQTKSGFLDSPDMDNTTPCGEFADVHFNGGFP